ncbi:hypothetical protein DDI_4147 [Dickeya dianthicola RNS04.9]|nr:hypothetical protein DDI_4147 [Dickeya dianthicola RNS04.9]
MMGILMNTGFITVIYWFISFGQAGSKIILKCFSIFSL